ncbi:MAG TPA: alpha/beta fold hydrolase [Gemmatimonadales bacterium]|nr:alpha/beta fold hydrolase [Gemmatimonadales bacterium]
MTRLLLLALLLAACRAPAVPEDRRFPAGTPFAAHELVVDGTRLRFIDTGRGRGPPVLLLHGLGASMYAWRKNIASIADAGYRVIAFDNRGFGFSDQPTTGYDNTAYARLVVALLDSLHLADAVLIGHSMGGAIAAEVAIEYPRRVGGLVLIASAGLGAREPLLFRVARWPLLGSIATGLRGRGFTARLLRSTYADPRKVTDSDVDQYYAPVARAGYGDALRGVLRQFRFDGLGGGRLEHIACPTLVLWGEADRWVPVALGRALAAGIARSALVIVPHAGHAVQEEAPEEVNRLVIKFLKEGLPRIPGDLARQGTWRATRRVVYFVNRLVEKTD